MGIFLRKDEQNKREEFWVPGSKLTRGPKDHSYTRLKTVLEVMDFTEKIHRIRETYYKGRGQRGNSRVKTLTTEKRIHDPTELGIMQHELGERSIICDANAWRHNLEKLQPAARGAAHKTRKGLASKTSRVSLKKRGNKIEHGFGQVLDSCGQPPTTLRRLVIINSRYPCAIIGFNLGLFLRKLIGVGTPREEAASEAAFLALCRWFRKALENFYGPPKLPAVLGRKIPCRARSSPDTFWFSVLAA